MPPEPPQPLTDAIAGRFEVVARVGEGAGGVVYRARDRTSGDDVAVKVPSRADPADDQLLRDEFVLRSEVSHPGLAAVRGLYEHEGRPVLVQEWIAGRPLTAWAAAIPAADRESRLLGAAHQLVEALDAMRAVEVVHGDIKPENILVDDADRVVLIDFDAGTSRWMERLRGQTGFFSGTRGYLAPELLIGHPISRSTDLYSLGAVLYEAATGRGTAEWPEDAHVCGPALESLVRGLLSQAPAARDEVARRFSGSRTVAAVPLIGREAELARLGEVANASRFQVVAIVGPAGIGKTTLLRTFLASRAARGEIVAVSRCHPTARVPFIAIDGWISTLAESTGTAGVPEALAAAFPLLGRGSAPAEDSELDEAFVELVRRVGTRLHLWIDDAQWPDADSVPLLDALRRAAPHGVTLYLSSRVPVPEADLTLDLAGLAEPDACALLARIAPDLPAATMTALARGSSGNPFLLTHLGAEEESSNELALHEVLQRRMSRAGAVAGRLLALMAVAVTPVRYGDAASWVGRACDRELSALRGLGLVRMDADGGETGFHAAHDRIREAVEQAADAAALREAHAHLAERLASAPSHVVAHHLWGAGRPDDARPHAVAAGHDARARRAWGTAAHWFDLARRCGADSDDVLAVAADCHTRAGQARQATQAWLSVAERRGPDADLARVRAAEVSFAAGDLERGRVVLDPLLRRLGLAWPDGVAWVASTAWWMVRLAVAERVGWWGFRPDASHPLRLRVSWALTGGLGSCDGLTAVAFGARHRFEAARSPDPMRQAEGVALRIAWAGTMSHEPALVQRLDEEVSTRIEAATDPSVRALLGWGAGYGYFLGGEMARARERLETALGQWAEGGFTGWEQAHCERHVAWAARYTGRYDRMATIAGVCADRGRTSGNRVHEHEVRAGLVTWSRIVADDPEGADQELDRIGRDLDVPPWFGLRYLLQHTRLHAAVYRGDAAGAFHEADDLWGTSWLLRQMLHVRVEVHLLRVSAAVMGGHRAQIVAEARRAMRALRRWDARWAVAGRKAAAACAAWAEGEPDPAAYTEVAAAYDALGMAAHADSARLHAAVLGAADPPAVADRLRARGVRRPERLANVLVPGPAVVT